MARSSKRCACLLSKRQEGHNHETSDDHTSNCICSLEQVRNKTELHVDSFGKQAAAFLRNSRIASLGMACNAKPSDLALR
jgi:hypothetical protein